MTTTLAPRTPVRKPVRKPKPAPKPIRLRPEPTPVDTPIPEGHVTLYKAWARAIRSALRAVQDIDSLGWMADEPECRGAIPELENDPDGLLLAQFRNDCMTIARALQIALEDRIDRETPPAVEYFLGRMDRPVEPDPRYPGLVEQLRKEERQRVVKRLGKHARIGLDA